MGQRVEQVEQLTGQPAEQVEQLTGQRVEQVEQLTGQPVEQVEQLTGQPVEQVEQLTGQPVEQVEQLTGQPVEQPGRATYGSASRAGRAVSCILDGALKPMSYTPLSSSGFLQRSRHHVHNCENNPCYEKTMHYEIMQMKIRAIFSKFHYYLWLGVGKSQRGEKGETWK